MAPTTQGFPLWPTSHKGDPFVSNIQFVLFVWEGAMPIAPMTKGLLLWLPSRKGNPSVSKIQFVWGGREADGAHHEGIPSVAQ